MGCRSASLNGWPGNQGNSPLAGAGNTARTVGLPAGPRHRAATIKPVGEPK
jgi:hypothetical protein